MIYHIPLYLFIRWTRLWFNGSAPNVRIRIEVYLLFSHKHFLIKINCTAFTCKLVLGFGVIPYGNSDFPFFSAFAGRRFNDIRPIHDISSIAASFLNSLESGYESVQRIALLFWLEVVSLLVLTIWITHWTHLLHLPLWRWLRLHPTLLRRHKHTHTHTAVMQ